MPPTPAHFRNIIFLFYEKSSDNIQKGRRLSFVVRCPSSVIVVLRLSSSFVVVRGPPSSVVVRRCRTMKSYKVSFFQKQCPFSQGVPKRGNRKMTTSTVMASRKGDPQHDVEGTICCRTQYENSLRMQQSGILMQKVVV